MTWTCDVQGSGSGDDNMCLIHANEDISKRSRCSAEDFRQSDVQWMLTGGAACSVALSQGTSVDEVKAQVQEHIGVPTSQQRLFLNGKELAANAAVTADSDEEAVLKLVRTTTDPCETDLSALRAELNLVVEDHPTGEFTYVRQLASSENANVFQYQRCRGAGQLDQVAVKKLRQEGLANVGDTETSERKAHLRIGTRGSPPVEDMLTELGVLKYLAIQGDLPMYLLRLQDVFLQAGAIWLVTELAEGGVLLGAVEKTGALPPVQAKAYSWQILQAVAYLHRHRIGHRDISLENVLLKNGGVRVMDFGMACRSSSASDTALRYFRAVGKDFYRAPECYVPAVAEVDIIVPAGASPGEVVAVDVGGKQVCEVRLPIDLVSLSSGSACRAEVFGYTVPPVDVWATGICLFTMMTGTPAWERADLLDPHFVFARQHGLAELLRQWRKPALPREVQELIDHMTGPQPAGRPTAEECLARAWFEAMRNARVALHQ